ncbi:MULTISPECIES: motility protein A [Paraclostridium]|jgi:chemotaxis protein MotA|uniref:motility protein A n=2 Tax=Peptostreptococcaceae TaxID=186804 RepID=UPI00051CD195|nr:MULTISPECIES: motility protein A [Paraclostridium]KGJ50119.1 flagellar motor protein MotP [Clostridium sp. NCR]MDU3336077.1 motility protein A [Paraclostridium bifermentans]OSB10644.1 motility protein A [Paraclostridium bifermentans]RDC49917.1 motility protein A [Acinetobacter sp. RIT592]
MKKNDMLTPVGLVLALGFVVYGISLGKTGIGAFVDAPSLAITVGGSFASVLITFSMEDLKTGLKITKEILRSGNINKVDLVDQFKELARKVRKDGPLAVEQEVSEIEDAFLRKGLELAIDGIDMEDIKEILEIEIDEVESKYTTGSKIFKIWGSYAPAFGMVGTLIGLIQMLSDMGSPDTISSGMAAALITTFYGALMANAILNPIGFNIQIKGERECERMDMMICGIMSIQNGDSTRVIEEKLVNFLTPKEKKSYYTRGTIEGEAVNVA